MAVNAQTDTSRSPGERELRALPDAELARRVAAGDHAAMRALMRVHNQRLYRTARAILKDDAEAEDAVQEAYLHAYRAIGGFRAEAKLSTWLVRIVANEALERYRRRSRSAQVIELRESTPADMEGDTLDAATPETPDQGAERAQTRRLLEKRIDALPDAFRAVFVMRAVEELSVEETAAALGIPEATVRTRFFRARSLLREAVARDIDAATQDAFSFAGARCDRIVERVMTRLERDARTDFTADQKETP